jgi:tRNASer (uridine44-2'-O)-methyltransferase
VRYLSELTLPPPIEICFRCGNGLLTHILLSCGYPGVGIDLRARTSWGTYSPHTQAHLRVDAFDPHALAAGAEPTLYTAPGQFVIANHADELTPWAPLLATRARASGFLSIPCCAWAFDARFERGKTAAVGGGEKVGGDELAALVESLNLGADAAAAASGYSQYRIWLAQLHRHCGWEIECEVLRIPSTRNWALVGKLPVISCIPCSSYHVRHLGRRRTGDEEEAQAHVDAILQSVWDRGIFKTRTPEGKTGNH